MLTANDFFCLDDDFKFKKTFLLSDRPWHWVHKIQSALKEFNLDVNNNKSDLLIPSSFHIKGKVFIHKSVKLPPYGSINGPCYIGKDTELRPGVYIRGNVIVGDSCVLGNSCEFKNSLILNNAQIPHFSYVGDSVIGNRSHLGAGVICSNLRLDKESIKVEDDSNDLVCTKMRKLGAIIADDVEIGCNVVLNPGSLIMPKSMICPSVNFKGTLHPGKMIFPKKNFKSFKYNKD